MAKKRPGRPARRRGCYLQPARHHEDCCVVGVGGAGGVDASLAAFRRCLGLLAAAFAARSVAFCAASSESIDRSEEPVGRFAKLTRWLEKLNRLSLSTPLGKFNYIPSS